MPKLLKPEAFYEKASDEAVRASCKPFPVEHILNLYQHYSLSLRYYRKDLEKILGCVLRKRKHRKNTGSVKDRNRLNNLMPNYWNLLARHKAEYMPTQNVSKPPKPSCVPRKKVPAERRARNPYILQVINSLSSIDTYIKTYMLNYNVHCGMQSQILPGMICGSIFPKTFSGWGGKFDLLQFGGPCFPVMSHRLKPMLWRRPWCIGRNHSDVLCFCSGTETGSKTAEGLQLLTCS